MWLQEGRVQPRAGDPLGLAGGATCSWQEPSFYPKTVLQKIWLCRTTAGLGIHFPMSRETLFWGAGGDPRSNHSLLPALPRSSRGVLGWGPHGTHSSGALSAARSPVPTTGPIPGSAFPHPALVLCLLIVILVVAVVTPPGSCRNDSPGLACGVVRCVFCRERVKLERGWCPTLPLPHSQAAVIPLQALWSQEEPPERKTQGWERKGGERTRGEARGRGAHPRRGNRL